MRGSVEERFWAKVEPAGPAIEPAMRLVIL
jgi:hypothetical protein